MKKTFIVLLALVVGSTVKAQKFTLGVKAGVQENSTQTKFTEDGEWAALSASGVGFHVGALVDYSLSEQFSIQPQLLFNSRSVKMSSESSHNVYAVDLPVNFLINQGGFFAGVGPNFSYGLSAKAKYDGETEDMYKKHDIEGGEQASILKRFEIGANALIGYKFNNGILISANYTRGLNNISGYERDYQKVTTRQIGLSIGYIIK
ncbi:MAG: PorT family protein [Chitinophagaceae bacterium]|nr:PorT family protein [Chitinophagaceae bacterium]MCW5927520.1 PorT family protein [Chitinophagaceae bacterium]